MQVVLFPPLISHTNQRLELIDLDEAKIVALSLYFPKSSDSQKKEEKRIIKSYRLCH